MKLVGPLLLALATAPASAAQGGVKEAPCPFDWEPKTHRATCFSVTQADGGTTMGADFAPSNEAAGPPVVHLPGGPGETPVGEDGTIKAILTLFPDRRVLTMNPRGVKGSGDHPRCNVAPLLEDELAADAARTLGRRCRKATAAIDFRRFDPRRLAADVDAFVRARDVERAVAHGVSFGTETALRLAEAPPPWLEAVVLDSFSPPDALDLAGQMAASDRFLAAVDAWCYGGEDDCADGGDLNGWLAKFDGEPLVVEGMKSAETPWQLDAAEMAGFLAGLAGYPDGVVVAVSQLTWLEDDPKAAVAWMAEYIDGNAAFVADSLPLTLSAYGGSLTDADRALPEKLRTEPPPYPTAIEDLEAYLALLEGWAEPKAAAWSPPARFDVPVLVLSGGLDPLTPPEWAEELDRALAQKGARYVFPELGHAVSLGDDWAEDADIRRQLGCAAALAAAFPQMPDDDCEEYRADDG